MAEPVLELSEHELYFLPPGTPVIAPATRLEVEVDGEKRAFLARWDWAYSRAEGRGCQSILYRQENVEETDIFGGQSWILKPMDEVSDQEKLERMHDIISQKRLNRFWRAPDATYGIVFFPSGIASIYWGWENHLVESVSFQWSLNEPGNEISLCSRLEFLEYCQRFYADKNSKLNYALRWKNLTPKQRDEVAFGCENGTWEILRRVLMLVQKVVTHHYGVFLPDPRSTSSRWQFDHYRELPPKSKHFDAAKWAIRWRAAICEIVCPSFWCEEAYCVQQWRYYDLHRVNLCRLQCTIPTHHEALEAQLELRDFLRPHLPPSEIEALFRPEG